jgi:hypothetical protein
MFEDLINSDEETNEKPEKPTDDSVIEALKWNVDCKEQMIKDLFEVIDQKDKKIEELERENKYLRDL